MTTKIQLTAEERECAEALVASQIQGLRNQGFEVAIIANLGYAATISADGVEMLIDPMSLLSNAHRGATVH